MHVAIIYTRWLITAMMWLLKTKLDVSHWLLLYEDVNIISPKVFLFFKCPSINTIIITSLVKKCTPMVTKCVCWYNHRHGASTFNWQALEGDEHKVHRYHPLDNAPSGRDGNDFVSISQPHHDRRWHVNWGRASRAETHHHLLGAPGHGE